MRRTLPAATFVVALVLFACSGPNPAGTDQGSSDRAPDRAGNDQRSSDSAPDFTVETFDGETFSLAEHRGTPVVLNFWESW